MTVAATKSLGTTLGYTTPPQTIGELTNIGCPEMTRETFDVTTHDSVGGYREFLSHLRDGGEMTVEGYMVGSDAGQQAISDHYDKDTDNGIEEMVITFQDGSTFTFDALCTAYKPGDAGGIDGAVVFSASFKVSGAPTLVLAGS